LEETPFLDGSGVVMVVGQGTTKNTVDFVDFTGKSVV
jgi:hypothetical protein